MQFNLLNEQEQVAQFAWRGMALGLISRVGCFPRASLGSFSIQRLPCILGMLLHMSSWLCVAKRSVGWRFGVLSSISPPSSPYSGEERPLLNSFSIELTVQCDGCLFWGLGWWVGLVAGLRVGQAYGVFHRPGFGLLVSVPRSLSAQPPFATQMFNAALIPRKEPFV